mgnify:CR=1 FL=1
MGVERVIYLVKLGALRFQPLHLSEYGEYGEPQHQYESAHYKQKYPEPAFLSVVAFLIGLVDLTLERGYGYGAYTIGIFQRRFKAILYIIVGAVYVAVGITFFGELLY